MTLVQDIRYGYRVLLKSPGFLVAAVISLALGIGANATIFTMINTIFLQPLPVERPAELMFVYGTDTNNAAIRYSANSCHCPIRTMSTTKTRTLYLAILPPTAFQTQSV